MAQPQQQQHKKCSSFFVRLFVSSKLFLCLYLILACSLSLSSDFRKVSLATKPIDRWRRTYGKFGHETIKIIGSGKIWNAIPFFSLFSAIFQIEKIAKTPQMRIASVKKSGKINLAYKWNRKAVCWLVIEWTLEHLSRVVTISTKWRGGQHDGDENGYRFTLLSSKAFEFLYAYIKAPTIQHIEHSPLALPLFCYAMLGLQ